ncbi:MAG: P22 phage major capsid protein family protein [Rudaea sp.]
MANITSTQLDDSIATIVAAQALGYLKANTVLARLVARDWDDEVATHGKIVNIPFTGALSVNAKSEGSTVTLQQPADTKVSVTLDKHKEVSFLLEDYGRALARPDFLSAYMADGVAKIAEEIDGDIAALYSGLSQTIDALSGLGEDDFREARRLLNAAHAPLAQRCAVLGPDADKEVLGIDRAVNAQYAQSLGGMLADAYTGRFMGFDIYLDQNVKVVAGAPNKAKNLFFQRSAFVLATRPLPPAPANAGVIQKVMDEDGIGLRVTLSYNPNYLGVQVTIDVLYGVAELRDNHGVMVETTAA